MFNFSSRTNLGWLSWFFVCLWSCQERRKCIQSSTTKDRLRCTYNCTAKFHHSRRPRTSSRPKFSIHHELHSARTEPGVNIPFKTCFDKCVRRKQSRRRWAHNISCKIISSVAVLICRFERATEIHQLSSIQVQVIIFTLFTEQIQLNIT